MTTTAIQINNSVVEVKELGGMIESWLNFIRVSPKTAATYRIAIKQWKKYCDDNGISRPARADVDNFVDALLAAKKSVATIKLYVAAIKIFYRWTATENLYPNITDHFKRNDVKDVGGHKKSALSANEGGQLIKSITGDKIIDKRNKSLIALTITAGLRTIELNRANVGDIVNEYGRYYLYVQGKGRMTKAEKVLIAEQVYSLIVNYLNARGIQYKIIDEKTEEKAWVDSRGNIANEYPLFVSHRRNLGGRLSTQTISKMIKRQLKAIDCNGKRYSAHSLRHSAACQMILAGVELRQVQAVLRHKKITTTMVYLDEVDRLKNTAEQTAANAFFANI